MADFPYYNQMNFQSRHRFIFASFLILLFPLTLSAKTEELNIIYLSVVSHESSADSTIRKQPAKADDKQQKGKKPDIKAVPKSKPQVKPAAVKSRIKIKTPIKKPVIKRPVIKRRVGLIKGKFGL